MQYQIVSENFLEAFCLARILNMEFGTRWSEEKFYWPDNDK